MEDADIVRVPCGAGSLHVERCGLGGPPVLLLHGFVTNAFLWRHVAPLIAKRHHTAWSVDLLGHGESDRPAGADFGFVGQAEALGHALAGLRLSRVTVVGADVGGLVALCLAHDRPALVGKLVLLSVPPLADPLTAEVRELQRRSARYAVSMTGVVDAIPLFQSYFDAMLGATADSRLVGRFFAPYVGRAGLDHLLLAARGLDADDLEQVDPRTIQCPAMVVRSVGDPSPGREAAQELARALPNGRFIELPGNGRLLPETVPAAVVDLCLQDAAV